jgi:hypothetical protein
MPRLEALLGCSPRLYPGLATAMPDHYRDFIALILGPLLQVRETKSVRLSNWLWRRESLYAKIPGVPGLALRPIQYRDSLCVGLGILPVTEGVAAPPFTARAFAFWYPGTDPAVA